jgi:hypothetical protein
MKTEFLVRIWAGTLVLTGLALAHFVALPWLWLDAFVGFMLIATSFIGFCPAEFFINKLLRRTPAK